MEASSKCRGTSMSTLHHVKQAIHSGLKTPTIYHNLRYLELCSLVNHLTTPPICPKTLLNIFASQSIEHSPQCTSSYSVLSSPTTKKSVLQPANNPLPPSTSIPQSSPSTHISGTRRGKRHLRRRLSYWILRRWKRILMSLCICWRRKLRRRVQGCWALGKGVPNEPFRGARAVYIAWSRSTLYSLSEVLGHGYVRQGGVINDKHHLWNLSSKSLMSSCSVL